MKNSDHDILSKVLLGVVTAKFGPGALGRIGTIAIAAFVTMTVIAGLFAFINPMFSLVIMGAEALLAFYVVHRAFNYAELHPELSAMDGTQISKIMSQQGSMKPLEGIAPPPPYIEATVQNPLIENVVTGA